MIARNGLERQTMKSAQGNSLFGDFKGMRAPIRSTGTRMDAFLRSGEEGQALVEFVLVTFFVLLPLLTGIFTCGIAYSNKVTLTNAVGQAAQSLQVNRSQTTTEDPCAIAWSALTAAAPGLKQSTSGSGTNGLAMQLQLNGGSAISGSSCPSDWNTFEGTQGDTNTVIATYPCNLAIYGMKFAAGCTITAQVAVYEY